MALTINAKTYTADSFQQNTVGYIGALKSVSTKDDVSLKRIAPKGTTNFSGVGRTQAKLTRTLTLVGALTPTWDGIITVDFTDPVGAASADVDAMLDDFGAFVASADFKTLVKAQKISY